MKDTRFPKGDHLSNWERRDNKIIKGDRVTKFRAFKLSSNCAFVILF